MPDQQDSQPPLADYRFSLANERTFLSWTRTGLALIAGGVAVEQLADLDVGWLVDVIGVLAIVLGGGIAAYALRHFRRVQEAIDHDRPLPPQPAAAVVSLGVGIIAVLLVVGIVVV